MQSSNSQSKTAGSRPPALAPALTFLTIALLCAGEARQPGVPGALLYYLAGALFVAAAAFLASSIVALVPPDVPQTSAMKRQRTRSTPMTRGGLRRWRAQFADLRDMASRIQPPNDSYAILATVMASACSLFLLHKGWRFPDPTPASMQAPAAGVLLALSFPLLVLERHFANIPPQIFPESVALSRLCRVPMAALLGLSLASLLRWVDFPKVATLLEHGVAVIVGLVGLESGLRGVAGWFTPRGPATSRRWRVDSITAQMLRLQRPDFASLSGGASRHFGIDLARSWALGFIRRAALPSLVALAACCWLLTGVSALSLTERAVYETLGRPAAVLQSGVHVHLPWPLGVLRPVEFGTIHEIPISFAADQATAAQASASTPPMSTDIEGPAPSNADRLWDTSHPSEASYLVASNTNERQNFQVINIDLRVLYRVGLSDEAARMVTYNVASPESIIRAAAGRMLARYFARYTLLDVLGQNRDAFIRGFQQELQTRLADLSTGIEIMGIVVEAIHPPAAAAAAYQGVQTASIRSVVQIAEAKAEAAQMINLAQGNATVMRNEAEGAATERVDLAKTELALFDGDRQAYNSGGKAFLLERRLQHFNKVLADVPFTVVDHRIDRADAPVLDLRPSSSARDSFASPEN